VIITTGMQNTHITHSPAITTHFFSANNHKINKISPALLRFSALTVESHKTLNTYLWLDLSFPIVASSFWSARTNCMMMEESCVPPPKFALAPIIHVLHRSQFEYVCDTLLAQAPIPPTTGANALAAPPQKTLPSLGLCPHFLSCRRDES
jgi:hypothetical protein